MFSLSQSLPLLLLRPAFPLEPVVLVAVETRRILSGLLRRSAKRRTQSRAPGIHLLCFDCRRLGSRCDVGRGFPWLAKHERCQSSACHGDLIILTGRWAMAIHVMSTVNRSSTMNHDHRQAPLLGLRPVPAAIQGSSWLGRYSNARSNISKYD